MNPPLRESPHSTWRTLVTRAWTDAAEHVEAHLVADVDLEALVDALLDRHFEQRRIRRPATALLRPELCRR